MRQLRAHPRSHQARRGRRDELNGHGMASNPKDVTAPRYWVLVLVVVVIAAAVLRYLVGPGPLAFAGGPTLAAGAYTAADPSGVPAALGQADLVGRGRYLTEAADCEACHTTPGGSAFAGGRAFKTPFGTLYSPNITADRDTGIGT